MINIWKFRPFKAAKAQAAADILPSAASGEIVSASLAANEQTFRAILSNCSDIVFRTVTIAEQTKILLIYVDGLVDTGLFDHVVLKPWMFDGSPQKLHKLDNPGQELEQQLVAIAQTRTATAVSEVIQGILKANIAIFADGKASVLLADLKGFEKRNVQEPTNEVSILGPKEGFTETLRVNTSLLRRKIQSPSLKMESFVLGSVTHTDIVVAYVEGIAADTVVEEVRSRINRIRIDSVLGSGYIEEFIEDHTFSPFPQIQKTERPDVVAANLLEGKVAIFLDGTPETMIVPFTFWTSMQAAEDYYERFIYASFIRLLRMMLFNLSLFLPSFYVAVTTFQPQLIPTNFLLTIATAREGVPFPAVFEALLMEVMFEGLREAGIRLPKPVGSAVSIVGALVIGQAAVEAGIVSAPMVIVVSITGISSFAIPRYNMGIAYRMLRFPMLIFSGMFGIYGIIMGAIFILIHLVNLQSFGEPYLSPVAPLGNLKDTFIRSPRWWMYSRPAANAGAGSIRIPEGQQPKPERGNQGG